MTLSLFSHHESELVSACYPKSSHLLDLAPEFKPPSQELSRLTYTASNKPGLLPKIAKDIEARAEKESARTSGGNLRYRASLLLTLWIAKALVTECRRDIALFSKQVVKIVDLALGVHVAGEAGRRSEGRDLEILSRAGSVWAAFATYTDGSTADEDYLRVLKKLSSLAAAGLPRDGGDVDMIIRARLVGLAALSASSASDALYSGSNGYRHQIDVIIPTLLHNIYQEPVFELEQYSEPTSSESSSRYFLDSPSSRPPLDKRRAPSIRTVGERDLAPSEIVKASLGVLKSVVQAASGVQLGHITSCFVAFLDESRMQSGRQGGGMGEKGGRGTTSVGWRDLRSFANWLFSSASSWSQLQYKFEVLTSLVEVLEDIPDSPPAQDKVNTLVEIIRSILDSPHSLVGLSTSDLLSSLLNVLVRRVRLDPTDGSLDALVGAVGSLGGSRHLYTTQTSDVVEDLGRRIAGVIAQGGGQEDANILRALITTLGAVIQASSLASGKKTDANSSSVNAPISPSEPSPIPAVSTPSSSSSSNNISPISLIPSIPALCTGELSVRAIYSSVLHLYLVETMRKPLTQSSAPSSTIESIDLDSFRFFGHLSAAVFTLALSPNLGLTMSSSRRQSNRSSIVATPPPERYNAPSQTGNSMSSQHNNSRAPARSSSLLPPVFPQPSTSLSSSPTSGLGQSAAPLDYERLRLLLCTSIRRMRVEATLAFVPMLRELQAHVEKVSGVDEPKTGECRRLLVSVWEEIETEWLALTSLNRTYLDSASFPQPTIYSTSSSTLSSSRPSSLDRSMPNTDDLIISLASSPALQQASDLDKDSLHRRLSERWDVDAPLGQIPEGSTMLEPAPVEMLHSLMLHHQNASVRSLQGGAAGSSATYGTSSRMVDVGDLRQALNGSGSGLARSSSIVSQSTSSRPSPNFPSHDPLSSSVGSNASRRSTRRAPGDVSNLFNQLSLKKRSIPGSGSFTSRNPSRSSLPGGTGSGMLPSPPPPSMANGSTTRAMSPLSMSSSEAPRFDGGDAPSQPSIIRSEPSAPIALGPAI